MKRQQQLSAKFRLDLSQHRDHVRAQAQVCFEAIALKVVEAIIQGNAYGNPTGTPVKTGFAKGSWAVDAAPTGGLGFLDPSGAQAVAMAAAKIVGWTLGTMLYLMNSAGYAIRLEYGWSKQAPAGMVRIVAANWPALVRDTVEEVLATT